VEEKGTTPDRRWRNRPLELERDYRRMLWLWTMLAAMVVTVLPAGAYLLHQNKCLEVSYEVSALATAHDRMIEEERRLRVKRAQLASLPSIESWARREHGLSQPDAQSVRVVGPPRTNAAEPTRQAATPRSDWNARAQTAEPQ
jgi:cell division protein FtsL